MNSIRPQYHASTTISKQKHRELKLSEIWVVMHELYKTTVPGINNYIKTETSRDEVIEIG